MCVSSSTWAERRASSFWVGFAFFFFLLLLAHLISRNGLDPGEMQKAHLSNYGKCPNQSICFECSEAETRNTKTWKFRIGYKSCSEALDNLELCISGRSAKAASHNPSATGAEAVRAQAFSVQNQKADRRSHLDLTTGSEEFPCLPNKKLNLLGTEPKKA